MDIIAMILTLHFNTQLRIVITGIDVTWLSFFILFFKSTWLYSVILKAAYRRKYTFWMEEK